MEGWGPLGTCQSIWGENSWTYKQQLVDAQLCGYEMSMVV